MILVVRAKKDIRPGTVISLDVLEEYKVPDSAYDPDSVKSTTMVIGKTALKLIPQGQQIRISDIEAGTEKRFVTSKWEQLKTSAERAVEQRVYKDAERYWQLALEESEQQLSKPMSVVCLDGLGDLYCLEKRYTDAEAVYTESLIAKIELVGEDHPAIALGLSKLSNSMYYQRKIPEVESLLARALPIFMQHFGPWHQETTYVIGKLERIYADQGKRFERPADPEKWLTEAKKIIAVAESESEPQPQQLICAICHRPYKGRQCLRCTQFGSLAMIPIPPAAQ
jgi:tetratricopeptide (TPR) repeat protein